MPVTGPSEEAVIQFAVQIHVHCLRFGVVHTGHVIPGIESQRGLSVARHRRPAGIPKFEAYRMRTFVNRRVQLKADPVGDRLDTIAASSRGKEVDLIHALIVMLLVSRRAVGWPKSI